MTSYLGDDLIWGTAYYRQAIALFGELGDKPGLTSSLATLTLRGPTYQTDSLVSAGSLAEAYQDAERALSIAREIVLRSAEAYALLQLGLCLGSQGEYWRALATVRLGNIMFKLGCTSCTKIDLWAIESGLTANR